MTHRYSNRTCLFLGTITFPQNSTTLTSCTLFTRTIFFFCLCENGQIDEFLFFFFFFYSDILAFFQGSPDGSIPGRDDLAKEIAAHAHEFVQERWREEDMRSFMYLLILEVSLVSRIQQKHLLVLVIRRESDVKPSLVVIVLAFDV